MSANNAEFVLENVFNVKDRTAVITGGGSRLGLMTTQGLAVNGCKVYIISRTEAKLKRVVDVHGQDIRGSIVPLVRDISHKDKIQRLVSEIEHCEPFINIFINNAGIYNNKQLPQGDTAEEVKQNLFNTDNATFADCPDIYATTVVTVCFVTTLFLHLLNRAATARRRLTSTVINISSINDLIKESLSRFVSNSAKAATIHLTKMLAVEVANCKLRIRVKLIAPESFPLRLLRE